MGLPVRTGNTRLEETGAGRRIVTTAIGVCMLAHGGWVLFSLPRSLSFIASASEELTYTGELAWLWNAGLPLRSHVEVGLWVLVNIGLIVGGMGVIRRRIRGVQIALAALALAAIGVGLTAMQSVSLALGWIGIDFDARIPALGGSIRFSEVPQSFRRQIWWWAATFSGLYAGGLLVAFLWLRRELARGLRRVVEVDDSQNR